MHWGHKDRDGNGITRAQYNANFNAPVPEQPDVPDAVTHVWEWWWQLNARRAPGFESAAPLTYSEIYHWSALTRTQVTAAEIGILIQMDDAYLQAVRDEQRGQREREREQTDKG